MKTRSRWNGRIAVVFMVVIHTAFAEDTNTQASATNTPPHQRIAALKPSDMYRQLAEDAKLIYGRHDTEVLAWEKLVEAKKSNNPIAFMDNISSGGITLSTIEKRYGKPNRVTEEVMGGLRYATGGEIRRKMYWYGNVGFSFMEGFNVEGSPPLYMMKYEPKLERAEPDGPANGSQPIRSETNRTSSAAGSRR